MPDLTKFHLGNDTHKETFLRFVLLVGLLAAYFFYMCRKYDASTGFGISILTWSFFVLCTPIADGGFVLAFPVRLLFGVKMWITQVIIWFFAVGLNLYYLAYSASLYQKSEITSVLHKILTQPYPNWAILILSAAGTILSIVFGDEMMDVTNHEHRKKFHQHGFAHKVILAGGLGLLTIVAYYHVLSGLDIKLPTG